MKTVKFSLLNLHLWTIALDYGISLFIIPFITWPTIGGVPLGILDFIGIPAPVQFYLVLVFVALLAVAILSLFEYRFYVLFLKPEDIWTKIRKPWLVLHYLIAFLYMAPLFLNPGNQVELLKAAYKIEPCLPNPIPGRPFYILTLDILYAILAALVVTLDIVIEVFFFFFYILYKIFQQLRAKRMSQKTYTMQKRLVIALFLQVLIPLSLLLAPIYWSGSACVFNYYNQGLNNLAMAIGSTHGICSTITMVLIHSPYRNVLRKIVPIVTPHSSVSIVKV